MGPTRHFAAPGSLFSSDDSDDTGLLLEHVSLTGVIQDMLADINVEQVYRNPESEHIEVSHTFALPVDASRLKPDCCHSLTCDSCRR